MENISLTYISGAIIVISGILQILKIDISQADLMTTITTLIAVVGGITVMIRRFKQGGITAFGSKIIN